MGRIGQFWGVAFVLIVSTLMANSAEAKDATVIDQKQVTGRLAELTVETPAFAEPTKLHVFLPDGYDSEPSRRWPVTYVLAGTMNNYNSFADVIDGEGLTRDYPSIIVSPDGDSGYWSDWFNGGAFGPPKYETFVIDQLIPLIDSRYRTQADRGHRAVLGFSMGGYGSMMYAARHPDLFGAAATLSGAVDSNLPLLGLALSFSSTFDGGEMDAINGPRESQEIRWRGHNPADLVENLRDVDVQVLTANGVLNPAIGEGDSPDDAASCVVEAGVHQGSVSFHENLLAAGVGHIWKDYGAGCHSVKNFTRETVDTLVRFKDYFASPPASPTSFDYRSIDPHFKIWGWQVDTDSQRALEFMRIEAGTNYVMLEGSGQTSITTPAWYRGLRKVDVNGTPTRPGTDGRLRFKADLGPAHTLQQYTTGATEPVRTSRVKLKPHAVLKVTRVKRVRRGVRVCVRAIGGILPKARITVGKRSVKVRIGAKVRCRTLRTRGRIRMITIQGRDTYGHKVKAKARVRPTR